jgi:hypothetical protein
MDAPTLSSRAEVVRSDRAKSPETGENPSPPPGDDGEGELWHIFSHDGPVSEAGDPKSFCGQWLEPWSGRTVESEPSQADGCVVCLEIANHRDHLRT